MKDKMTRQKYIDSKVWDSDEFLLNPIDAAKRCRLCGEKKFSVEFPNYPETIDEKSPCCVGCIKSRSLRDDYKSLIVNMGLTIVCIDCGSSLPLSEFGYRKVGNTFSKVCRGCTGAVDFKKIF